MIPRYQIPEPTAPAPRSLLEVAGHISAPTILPSEPIPLMDIFGGRTANPFSVSAGYPQGSGGFDPLGWVVEHPYITFAIGAALILVLAPRGRR